jgi:mannose-6-phosphate isomerase-like protein (cupin superfamily)
VISLPPAGEKYASLINGPPETQVLRSGYVFLSPGEAVGEHTTGECEEMLVPLSGHGELQVPGLDPLPIQPGCVLYNPPNTPHDVVNTGSEPLRYIYIVTTSHTG